MRVPVYDNLQTGVGVAGNASLRNQDVGAIGEIGARQAEAMAQALGHAGDVLTEETLKRQAMVNEADAKAVDIDTQRQVREVLSGADGYLNKEGGNAVSAREETQKKIRDIYAKAGDALTNDEARRMWSGVAGQREADALDQIEAHYGQAQEAYAISASKARIASAREDAYRDVNDPVKLAVDLASIADEAGRQVEIHDQPPEAVALAKRAALAETHAILIDRFMAANDPLGAQAYFTAHADDFPADARAKMAGSLKDGAAAATALGYADEAFEVFKLKSPWAAYDRDAIDSWARKRYGSDAYGLSLFRAEVDRRISDHQNTLAAKDQAAIQAYSEIAARDGEVAARKSQAWRDMSPGTRLGFSGPKTGAAAELATAARAPGRDREVEATIGNISDYDLYNMRPDQFDALLKHYPRQKAVLTKRKADLDKLPVLPPQLLDSSLRALGLDPSSNNKEMQQRVGTAKYNIAAFVQDQRAAADGPLKPDQLVQIMESAVAQTVDVDQPLAFGYQVRRTVPIGKLTFDDIPAGERNGLMTRLRQSYQQTRDPKYMPTQQNALHIYIQDHYSGGDTARRGY